jgi:hypothetical protein
VDIESWQFKFENCMWNVWNLKFWELKCLNWDVWILKAKNWKLKIENSMWSIWNLKIEIFEFGCVNIESWKLKSFCEMFGRNLKIWKLKCLNTENKKLKCLNIEN